MSKFNVIIFILGFVTASYGGLLGGDGGYAGGGGGYAGGGGGYAGGGGGYAGGGGAGGGAESDAITNEFTSLINEDGTYSYKYSTSNGIQAQEQGLGGSYASGSATHYAPDGQLIQLTYTADESGFHPEGAHLPTPPPIPDYVLRAIEWNAAHPETDAQQGQQTQSSQKSQATAYAYNRPRF